MTVDVMRVRLVRVQAEKTVLADLHDPLRAGDETDNQRLRNEFELAWRIDAGNQRHVRGLDAAVGEINAGRSF